VEANVPELIIAALVLGAIAAFAVWGSRRASQRRDADATASTASSVVMDSRAIGVATGLTGGTIQDAAIVSYVLERHRVTTDSSSTARDIGTAIGLEATLDGDAAGGK
jgi:hypothetical protein